MVEKSGFLKLFGQSWNISIKLHNYVSYVIILVQTSHIVSFIFNLSVFPT